LPAGTEFLQIMAAENEEAVESGRDRIQDENLAMIADRRREKV
jgi:hypothetical protein